MDNSARKWRGRSGGYLYSDAAGQVYYMTKKMTNGSDLMYVACIRHRGDDVSLRFRSLYG